MDPILSIFFICSSIIAVFCWVATLITNNYSQIDRLWSILPMFYSWCFVFTSYMHNNNKQQQQNIIDERTTLMSCLITLWGIRLTYNYWRKGGYKKGEEDYRWTHVKKMFYYPEIKIIFHLFNFVFIAFIQNWLLLSLALPLWTVQTNAKEKMLNIYDLVLAGFFFIFFLIEVVADEQQWHFQQNKKKWLKSNDNKLKFSSNEINDFKQGFLTQGLFRYSRHPNFFGELSMWWTIYMFTLTSETNKISVNSLVNYSIIGPIVLTAIFLKSTPLTEKISLSKYPKYEEYKSKVSRIIPWFSNLNIKNE